MKFPKFKNPFRSKSRQQIEQLQSQVKSLQTARNFQASLQNRLFEDWVVSRASLNDDIRSGLVATRVRARKLAWEDDYGKKFIGLCKSNIVGPDGLKLELNIKDDNGKADQKAIDIIKSAWDKWSKKENASADQQHSFFDLQNLLATSTPTDGEYFVRPVEGYPHNPFGFAIQIIEPDCVDEQLNYRTDRGTHVIQGVERDQWKRRIAYYVKAENPYESYTLGIKDKAQRIDASEIIHGFVPIGLNQVRGMTWFLTPMPRMQMLNGYDEAAMVAARTAACKMGFLEEKPDAAGNYSGAGSDENGNAIMEASPGSIERLPPGFTFSAWDPSYPHTEHGNFIKASLRGISAGLLVSYNSLANDLEGVNYSSIRAGLIDERDMWKIIQKWKIIHLWNDVFGKWLKWAITSRQVNLPYAKFEKFNQPAFIPRRWPWVDPEKDIKATILSIQNGLTTYTDAVAETGGNFTENVMTLQADNQQLEKAKIKPTGLKGYEEPAQPEPSAPASK